MGSLGQLRICASSLHGEKFSAGFYQGKTELQQYVQPSHGAAHRDVKAFPVPAREFLRPGGNAVRLNAKARKGVRQPLDRKSVV